MAYLFIFASLVCAILMFKVKIEYKIAILLLSFILFTYTGLPFASIKMSRFILICFILSELGHYRCFMNAIRGTFVWKITGVFLLSMIILIIGSPHLRDLGTLSFLIRDEMILKYFVLLYMYYACKSSESLRPAIRISYYGLIILTVLGILNFFMHESIYISSMSQISGGLQNSNIRMDLFDGARNRVQSLFLNPFDYGYICMLLMLFHLYGFKEKMEGKTHFAIALGCCLFGIVACGSRTVILSGLIGFVVFCLLGFKATKGLRVLMIISVLFFMAYMTVPSVGEKVDETLSMFDKNSNMEGSTVEGRNTQFTAVFYHIKDNLLLGRGYLYFVQDLGWGKGKGYLVDKDLYGLEGVMMNYLLERGIVGLIFYYIYYISLFVHLWKRRKLEKTVSALGISVLAVYMFFANMTGELNSVIPTLLLVGCTVKLLDVKNNVTTPVFSKSNNN